MPTRPPFRLILIGSLDDTEQAQTLTILAEYKASRAIERVTIQNAEKQTLNKQVADLRGFVEGGFPELDENQLQALGKSLFNLVIIGTVQSLFWQATGAGQELLPLQIIAEDYAVAGWPWEYLFDYSHFKFICQEFHPVTRDIFTRQAMDFKAHSPRSLHILVIIGVLPESMGTTPAQEVAYLQDVFKAYLANDDVELRVVQAIEPAQLLKELQKQPYDIVHYYGHAAYDPGQGQGYLSFERQGAAPFRFYAGKLAQLLAQQDIRLVFLNACETARSGSSRDPKTSSLAGSLLASGIPAVIATQFTMPDNSSHQFAAIIYNSLVLGRSLADAMRDGRQAMGFAEQNRFFDWGIPVLYSSMPEATLFAKPKQRAWSDKIQGAVSQSATSPDIVMPTKGLESMRDEGVESLHGGSMAERDAGLESGRPALQKSAPRITQSLGSPLKQHEPSMIAERTFNLSLKQQARITVALADVDAKVTFLPELADMANRLQAYYNFQVVFLPIPSGYSRMDMGEVPQFYIPRVESYLRNQPADLQVDFVCCLTRCLIAEGEGITEVKNFLSETLQTNPSVAILSTYRLRDYAEQAGVSFAKATLHLCLKELLLADSRWNLEEHQDTAGCLLDSCERHEDLMAGLRKTSFDHAQCRAKIKDNSQLDALDALMGFDIDKGKQPNG